MLSSTYTLLAALLLALSQLGDADADGDVDLDDFANLVGCVGGPNLDPPLPHACLDSFDFNYDGDVDIDDVIRFTVRFTGSVWSLGAPQLMDSTLETVLNLTVLADGGASIVAPTGVEVEYEVIGELSDEASQGLAFAVFDLVFSGGSLSAASVPADPPMSNFVIPLGITNPAGYGGTTGVPRQEGELVQVGGGQNVVMNTVDNAPHSIGTVITDIAQPGSPAVLASGTLITPDTEGTYTLNVVEVIATIIKQGESGDPFWATESIGVGSVANLTVVVQGSPPNGACCSSGGSCTVTTAVECNLQGGTYVGDDSVCDDDADGDGVFSLCGDLCPDDPSKTDPGICGCGVTDDDSDSDGAVDCHDGCPSDPSKVEPGVCGCGVPDNDTDSDGIEDCNDACPLDAIKIEPGVCGCGVTDYDTDLDTVPDCNDQCPGQDDLIDANENGTPDCTEEEVIPTLSQWGLLTLVLLLLVGGKTLFGRRQLCANPDAISTTNT